MLDPSYVIRLEEGAWGALLVAITLAMHGFGMLMTLRVSEALKTRFQKRPSFFYGMGVIVLASWMILVVHIMEVSVWARFFLWKSAVAVPKANASLCFYFALGDYTTLGTNYNLKLDWRLLEGMIAIAGLLTFAWSTGILLTLAQEFQEQQLARYRRGHRQNQPKAAEAPNHPPDSQPS